MKLSYRDRSNRVQFVMKSKQDSNVINPISLVYVDTETELSKPIWSSMVLMKTKQDNDVTIL